MLLRQSLVHELQEYDVPVGHPNKKARYESPIAIPNFTRQAWLFGDSNYLHCSFRSVSGTIALSKRKFSIVAPHFVYRLLSYRGLFLVRSADLLNYFQSQSLLVESYESFRNLQTKKTRSSSVVKTSFVEDSLRLSGKNVGMISVEVRWGWSVRSRNLSKRFPLEGAMPQKQEIFFRAKSTAVDCLCFIPFLIQTGYLCCLTLKKPRF